MDYQVIVIGGGLAGLTAGLELSRTGISVLLVEKKPYLGGQAAGFACMATEQCQKCGACLPVQIRTELVHQDKLTVLTGYEVLEINPNKDLNFNFNKKHLDSGYSVSIRPTEHDYKEVEINTGKEFGTGLQQPLEIFTAVTVLIASGYQPFSAGLRGEFGYGRYPGVVSSLDLEQVWQEQGRLDKVYGELGRVAFVQCVGSRDRRGGNPFCSKVCCRYALRMARRLIWESNQTAVSLFYMDFQECRPLLPGLTASDKGISLIRSMPSQAYQLPGRRVVLKWESPQDGETKVDEFDLLVLSVGIMAGDFNSTVSQCLGLKMDLGGFLIPSSLNQDAVGGLLPMGIFLAGTCCGPADMQTTFAQGKRAASQIMEYLTPGS